MSFWLEFVLQPLRICGLLPATLQMELLVECEEKVDGEDEWMDVQGGRKAPSAAFPPGRQCPVEAFENSEAARGTSHLPWNMSSELCTEPAGSEAWSTT